MSPLDVSPLERIATLLGAASQSTDLSVRTIYLAEARIQLEATRAKLSNLGLITDAEERELVRMKAAIGDVTVKEGRSCASTS